MITGQYERAKQLLTEHKEGHAELAQVLMEREVIFAEDVEKIFGKRPWASRSEEIIEQNSTTDGTVETEETTAEAVDNTTNTIVETTNTKENE